MKIEAKWLDSHQWFLRTSDNGVSYGKAERTRTFNTKEKK